MFMMALPSCGRALVDPRMSSRNARQDRPLVEQHEEWTAHLRQLFNLTAYNAMSCRVTTTSTSGRTRSSTTPGPTVPASSRQAVATSPAEPAEVEPARDGTTYVVVGTAGTPRYGWTGKHAPPAPDRDNGTGSRMRRPTTTTSPGLCLATARPAARMFLALAWRG
jgi:hypothetical protein